MSICADAIFKNVFDKWQKPLQIFLQARGMEIQKAADCVQDCFIKLWDNCDKVELDKAQSYLYTIATRLQIDEFRKAQVRLKYRGILSSAIDKQDGQYTLEEKEFKAKLEETIHKMTESSRVVFLLNRFEDKTYKEIASMLNISVKAVEKRMSLALSQLYKNNILKKK